MNFSSQLFVVNNKPVMLTSSLDLSNICSFDKTVVLASIEEDIDLLFSK